MNHFEEIWVDNFAGGGGASLGIENGGERPVDIAINHDAEAISLHKANHPQTQHYINDVWSIDPVEVTNGKPVGLAWFSPDCKHFSRAKGGKPVEKNIRDLAWVVIKWAAAKKPRVIMLENVEEFQDWGPLDEQDKPIKALKGSTFNKWKSNLEDLGYIVEHKVLRACDYGAPTIRKRLFLIARCDGQPITWPVPTHGEGLLPYKTAADCIDWSIESRSIFDRPKMLAEKTLIRIVKGLDKYVLNHPDPFVMDLGENRSAPYTTRIGQTGKVGDPSRGMGEPVSTIVSKNEHILVEPSLAPFCINTRNGERKGQEPRTRSVTDPYWTVTSQGSQGALIQGKLSPFVIKHYGGVVGVDARTPMPTITARGTQNQLCLGHLIKFRNNCVGQDIREPLGTVTSGGHHFGIMTAYCIKYYGTACGQSINDPMHSITSKDRFGLIEVQGAGASLTEEQRYNAWWVARLLDQYGNNEPKPVYPHPRASIVVINDFALVDILMRMFEPRELFNAQGFPQDFKIDIDHNGKPLTKTALVRMCGNSVCPPLAKAIVDANMDRSAIQFEMKLKQNNNS